MMREWKLFAMAGATVVLAGVGAVLAADGKMKPLEPTVKNHPLHELWSGYHFAMRETQQIQDDDFANPGMVWYDIGAELWTKKDGKKSKACADCHQNAAVSMKGVGTRYPIYYKPWKKLMGLEARINMCRERNMGAKKWKYDSDSMLSMMIYVKGQSRGMPMKVRVDGPAKPFFEKGKAFYYKRRGQLDMACSDCHEKYYGREIRMNLLSQGQSNGFPIYRLKWQKPGSIHRRFKGCNKQVRAAPYKSGSDEYTNLEFYLAWRGNGLVVETPGVRN